MPEGDKLRKFKGRTVFQENNVRDENSDVALFSELTGDNGGLTKAVDAYGAQPDHRTQQNDGVQAYTQALMVSKHGSSYLLTAGQRNGEANTSGR